MDHAIEIRQEAHDPCTFPPPPAALQPPSISLNPLHQIRIRHPHYPNLNNILFSFFAPDIPSGGIEYGVAHAACGLVSGNRWDGWFTTTVEGTASTLTFGDILCEGNYYFHLPESSLETPYAIVPTFKEWTFPHENLHPCWHANQEPPPAQGRFLALSSLSAAVYTRDESCRMSGFTEGTQTAHLCPRSEEDWFLRNEMMRYTLQPRLVGKKPMEDTANALTLRQDLHTQFDDHKFVFVPKKIPGEEEIPIVTHLLIASRELGILHHNVRLKAIPGVARSFLFARFAWSIFTHLRWFLVAGVDRTLIGATISTPSRLPQIVAGADCRKLILGSKSRTQSPTKRRRGSSNTGVEGDADESGERYKRQKEDNGTVETDASQSTEEPDNLVEPEDADDIMRLKIAGLREERLRSGTGKAWLKEVAWARHIRSEGQVMGPAEASRLHQFWGYEIMDTGPEDDDDATW